MVKLIAYVDEASWARQLSSLAASLKADALAITYHSGVAKAALRYFSKVYLVKTDLFEPHVIAGIMSSLVKEVNGLVAALPCSNKGRILAGLVAAKLSVPVYTDVVKINVSDNSFDIEKLTFGGTAIAKVKTSTKPLVLCIAPGAYPEAEAKVEGELVEVEPGIAKVSVSFKPKKVEGVEPDKAEVVVGAGRGLKKREDLEMIKELAELLGGAWSVTRPLAADYGWADTWIGVTGLVIKPKLYIAVGISGQPHHVMGVRGSKVIVAINNDESAPIFDEADYGVVGDLYKVLPVLIKKLRERRKG